MAESADFVVDTSILIDHLRKTKRDSLLIRSMIAYGQPVASEMTVFELEVGARRRNRAFEFDGEFPLPNTVAISRPILIQAAVLQATLLP